MATTLRFRHAALAFLLPLFAGTSQAADEALPPSFAAIVTAPSDLSGLEMHSVTNHDGDGEGEEMPSAKVYYEAGSKDFATSMTVTDLSLCKRPAEHAICLAFRNQISAAAPALSTDITNTRIGGRRLSHALPRSARWHRAPGRRGDLRLPRRRHTGWTAE
jgi:hypothetical protein